MGLPAIPHRGSRVRRFPLESTQTFVEGALVALDADGEVIAAGADPTAVLGFAAHDAVLENDPDPGFVLVYPAYPDATFWISGSADPAEADVGDDYGTVDDANGVATLDKTEAVNLVYHIEGIDSIRNLYEVSVLAAVRQLQV